MSELFWLTVAEASAKIRAGELSPVDYVDALLARIEKVNPKLDAFLLVTAEQAREQAQAAEKEIAEGRWRGPMHGIPYALKDIIDTAGILTTCHSKILENNVPAADAIVARHLKAAGGILLGKTATHEFAIGGPSFDLPWPPARNPWNPDHHPGGSSSGSGSAITAGMVPAALGTDTGGSVRNPASMCGIVGLKPTYGRVSRRGVFPLSFSLDHIGPMTRTVEDNAILLTAIAGHDPDDAGSANVPSADYTDGLKNGIEGMRIGFVRHFHETDLEADAEMAASLDAAASVFEGLGATVGEAKLAPLSEFAAVNRAILMAEAYSIHEKWLTERPGDYAEKTRKRLLPGGFMRAADYVRALRIRSLMVAEFQQVMRSYDLLICASSMETAARIDDDVAVERTYPRQARTVFNVLGAPAIAMPGGFSQYGLPLSFQIVGRMFDEAAVYRAAWAYEQATDWRLRRPPID